MLYLKKTDSRFRIITQTIVDENGNRKDGVPGEGYWAVTKAVLYNDAV